MLLKLLSAKSFLDILYIHQQDNFFYGIKITDKTLLVLPISYIFAYWQIICIWSVISMYWIQPQIAKCLDWKLIMLQRQNPTPSYKDTPIFTRHLNEPNIYQIQNHNKIGKITPALPPSDRQHIIPFWPITKSFPYYNVPSEPCLLPRDQWCVSGSASQVVAVGAWYTNSQIHIKEHGSNPFQSYP